MRIPVCLFSQYRPTCIRYISCPIHGIILFKTIKRLVYLRTIYDAPTLYLIKIKTYIKGFTY
jgi:hypothetical protein